MHGLFSFTSKERDCFSLIPARLSHAQDFMACMPPEVAARFSNVPKDLTLEQEQAWIKQMEDSPTDVIYAIVSQTSIVGVVGLHNINKLNRSARIGIVLKPQYKGQGLGYAAMRSITQCGFEMFQLNKIILRFRPDNVKMVCLADRLGFQREGYLTEDYADQSGQLHDIVQMCLLKRWWEASKKVSE